MLISGGSLYASGHIAQIEHDDFELYSADGYRLFRYRSPTPLRSEYAETLNTQQLFTFLRSRNPPYLLDVQPVPWNRVFIDKEDRYHIPGSMWLPNVGLGELEEEWKEYFRSNLEKLTQSDKNAALVIYCRADCWMSWNALKRASGWGYTQLYWYRNGTDGWAEHELEMVKAIPVPFKKE